MIYALLGLIGFGVADYLVSKLSKETGQIKGMLWNTFFMLLYLFLINITFGQITLISSKQILIAVMAAIFHTLGGLSFYRGSQVGKLSLLSPIASSYSLVIILFSILFLEDNLVIKQWISIFFVIIGTLLASTNLKEIKNFKLIFSDKSIPYGLLSLLFWGIGFIFIGNLTQNIGWKLTNFYISLVSTIILIITSIFKEKSLLAKTNNSYIIAAILGIFSLLGYIGYSIGVESEYASIIGPIVASAPIVTIALAFMFLKERVTKEQIFGTSIIILGLILLAI